VRILNIVCGVSVLFTTLAYAHLLHHHLAHALSGAGYGAGFWAVYLAATVAGIFALVGGCLLLKRIR
jgi:hypothetical protein